jgi:hypothetical protein
MGLGPRCGFTILVIFIRFGWGCDVAVGLIFLL